jgi:hypothetical protein
VGVSGVCCARAALEARVTSATRRFRFTLGAPG